MGNYLLAAGLLLNSALIIMNRFLYRIPNKIQIPLLILGISLIITGGLMMR